MLNEICDNDTHILHMQEEPVDSDHPVYLVVKIESTEHWGDLEEDDPDFNCEIHAVSPEWVKQEGNLESQLEMYSISQKEFDEMPVEGQVELLVETSCSAVLDQFTGNDEDQLLDRAKKELLAINVIFGVYMNKPQNRMGARGWDWIKGNLDPITLTKD